MLRKTASCYFSAASAPVEQQFRCLLSYLINEDSFDANVFLLRININNSAIVNIYYPVTIILCFTYWWHFAISAPAQRAVFLRITLTNTETESTCPLLLLNGTITMSQGFTVRTRPYLRTPSSKGDLSQSSRGCLVMGIFWNWDFIWL